MGRVIEELRRVVDPELVGQRKNNRLVTVGTERDLAGLEPVDLAVAIDADGLVRGTNYRSAEDALAILARVAATVSRDTGRRMVMQTADPRHPIFEALRRGDPVEFLEHELKERIQLSLPPAGEVIVLEVRGLEEPPTLAELESEATVFGPAPIQEGWRWLIQASDLTPIRLALASVVAKLRQGGATVRVDVDPRDL